MKNDYRQDLLDYMDGRPVINTHKHHQKRYAHAGYTLREALLGGYLGWCGVTMEDDNPNSRAHWLDAVRAKSYFVALQKGLCALYGIGEPITLENWGAFDKRIAAAHADDQWQWTILREHCHYEHIIQDEYVNPGAAHGPAGWFTPAYRVNLFAYGYDPDAKDHNGNSPSGCYGFTTRDLDEYIAFMRQKVKEKKQAGCVALKSAAAYEHGLDFTRVSAERAQQALSAGADADAQQRKDFRDYIFYALCDIAASLDLPFQIHTGLGQMTRTNAGQLNEVIAAKPDTKFVLFHGSYPWIGDVAGLLHVYPNVYPDLCWLPLLSPTACALALHQYIEIGLADRLCWGCDTWTSEDSYGALLMGREVVTRVLSEKVCEGYMRWEDACRLADRIFYSNAKSLYQL